MELVAPVFPLTTAYGLQVALNNTGISKSVIGQELSEDGIAGKNTMKVVESLLSKHTKRKYLSWSDARQLIAAEQAIYKIYNLAEESVQVDGLIGEQTRYLRSIWETKTKGDDSKTVTEWRDKDEQLHPEPTTSATTWPKQNEAAMIAFFGPRGSNQVSLQMPFPLRVAWEPTKRVTQYSCHKKVHKPMLRIWNKTKDHYGLEQIKKLRLDMYGGCLNVRRMRGGSSWSIHSWGCAYDVDPDRNQLKFTRESALLDDPPYKKFWEFVYAEGAISLGIERDRDWMHFQFARL